MANVAPIDVAYAMWQVEEELARQRNIVVARDYYEGEQAVPLTERQKAYLGFLLKKSRWALNYCKSVVNAPAERMIVSGFTAAEDDDPLALQAWEWWEANRFDGLQGDVHTSTYCDGQYFVFVDWDEDEGRPTWTLHERYTDPQVDGTGYGCKAFYPDDDHRRPCEYITKRWTEQIDGKPEQRLNLYRPDQIERYILRPEVDGGWDLYSPPKKEGKPAEQAVEDWLGTDGKPIGIPIIHFKNKSLKTELWDAIPVQDAINKQALDMLGVCDASGFPILWASGFIPTDDGLPAEPDGSNLLHITPGAMIATDNVDAKLGTIPVADLSPMLEALDSLIIKLAQITDTPISRFQMSRQVAAEGTLKQQEEPLLAKVRDRQVDFGNAWEDVMYMSRRLANTFGGADLDADTVLSTTWEPIETRDDKVYREGLLIEMQMGVPQETLWAKMGYSPEEIAVMRVQRADEMQQESNIGGALLKDFERGGVG